MKVPPFYTVKKTSVYHNDNECYLGNDIEKDNIRQGTGGYKLCFNCKKLNKSKK